MRPLASSVYVCFYNFYLIQSPRNTGGEKDNETVKISRLKMTRLLPPTSSDLYSSVLYGFLTQALRDSLNP